MSAAIDLSGLTAFANTVRDVMEHDAVEVVGRTFVEELPKLYDQGIGGDGVTLPPYDAGYARSLGISTTPKTLKRSEGRLHDLELVGDTVTVKDVSIERNGKSVSTRTIAHGQQTGGSGRWGHSNVMFGHNTDINAVASRDLADHIIERLNAQ